LSNWIEPEQAAAVSTAVAEAERRSSGEIVPVLLSAADDYEVAYWKAATLGALAAELVALAGLELAGGWGRSLGTVLLAGVGGGLFAALAVLFLPRLRPLLAGREKVERRIAQRAREAFLSYEVFRTKARTGILICVFTLEHRVVVLADEGIDRVAPKGTWEAVAAETARAMREHGSGAALLGAVQRCGELLVQRGLARAADDANELADHVRGEFR
jgi:putative membrane protein